MKKLLIMTIVLVFACLFSSSQIAYARLHSRSSKDEADGLQYKKEMGHNSEDKNFAQQLHESERLLRRLLLSLFNKLNCALGKFAKWWCLKYQQHCVGYCNYGETTTRTTFIYSLQFCSSLWKKLWRVSRHPSLTCSTEYNLKNW